MKEKYTEPQIEIRNYSTPISEFIATSTGDPNLEDGDQNPGGGILGSGN